MRRVGAVLLLKPILSLALTMHHIASRRVVRAAARAPPRSRARAVRRRGRRGPVRRVRHHPPGPVRRPRQGVYDGAGARRRLQRAASASSCCRTQAAPRHDRAARARAAARALRDRADTPDGRPAISAVTSGDLVHDAPRRGRAARRHRVRTCGRPAGRACGPSLRQRRRRRGRLVSRGGSRRASRRPTASSRGPSRRCPAGRWRGTRTPADDVLAARARGSPLGREPGPRAARRPRVADARPAHGALRDAARGAAHPVGKLRTPIYERRCCCAPAGRVPAVGDSMAHDVAGANRAGVDSALVCWGIHAADGRRAARRRAARRGEARRLPAAFEPRDRPTVLPAFRAKSSVGKNFAVRFLADHPPRFGFVTQTPRRPGG